MHQIRNSRRRLCTKIEYKALQMVMKQNLLMRRMKNAGQACFTFYTLKPGKPYFRLNGESPGLAFTDEMARVLQPS